MYMRIYTYTYIYIYIYIYRVNPSPGSIRDDTFSRNVTGGKAASSWTSDSRVLRVTHTHTLVQKTGVSPVRRHWRAQQRDVSIPEGGPRRYRQGLRDA